MLDYQPDERRFVPGTVVEVRFSLYKHYAIASDRGSPRRPTLIGLSQRTGRVAEEPWSAVARGRDVHASNIRGALPGWLVVARARACIGRPEITWNLLTRNCEHFVRAVHGLPVESTQVQNAIGGAVLGLAATLLAPPATLGRVLLAVPCGALIRMSRFAQTPATGRGTFDDDRN